MSSIIKGTFYVNYTYNTCYDKDAKHKIVVESVTTLPDLCQVKQSILNELEKFQSTSCDNYIYQESVLSIVADNILTQYPSLSNISIHSSWQTIICPGKYETEVYKSRL